MILNLIIMYSMMMIKLNITYLKRNLLINKNCYAKYAFKIKKHISLCLADTFVIVNIYLELWFFMKNLLILL